MQCRRPSAGPTFGVLSASVSPCFLVLHRPLADMRSCLKATELRLNRADRTLDVAFADGMRFTLPVEYFRVENPSAEVQGHGPGSAS